MLCFGAVSSFGVRSVFRAGGRGGAAGGLGAAVESIGIVGGGTVGGGIVDILSRKKDAFSLMTGKELRVDRLAVRDVSKERNFSTPASCKVTGSYMDVVEDPGIDTVVEVMGGTTEAKEVVFESLRRGKNVVTANKALVAMCLPEIEALVKEVNEKRAKEGEGSNGGAGARRSLEFRYEAAVCEGIPIISSMQSDFAGDDVTIISGIINGCTNYMLTAMDQDGLSYDESLSKASELGYTKADPALDVGGFDARSKLKILIRLAFGLNVEEDDITCRGIPELTKEDFEYARMLGGTVKLMGVAKR